MRFPATTSRAHITHSYSFSLFTIATDNYHRFRDFQYQRLYNTFIMILIENISNLPNVLILMAVVKIVFAFVLIFYFDSHAVAFYILSVLCINGYTLKIIPSWSSTQRCSSWCESIKGPDEDGGLHPDTMHFTRLLFPSLNCFIIIVHIL